jgi:mono/diheme cytochrome c family protein
LAASDSRFPIEPANTDSGKALYDQFCAACHGIDGAGEQPDPLSPGAAPPHNADGHTWHHPDQQNFLTVWQGRTVPGVMPGFYERLTPDEIISVLAYIKTWWLPDQLDHQMEQTQRIADQ